MSIPLPHALVRWLDAQVAERFEAGASLLVPDATPTHVWFLRTGLVRVYTLDREGAEFNHDFVGPGEWVFGRVDWRDGEVCCAERAIGAIALQATEAVRVTTKQLAEWRDTQPTIASYLLDALVRLAATRLAREADLVQRSAEDRYRELVARRPDLLDRVPLREIAGWLGITPVALSRIRRRLRA